jgi:hypothetical protein
LSGAVCCELAWAAANVKLPASKVASMRIRNVSLETDVIVYHSYEVVLDYCNGCPQEELE